jgi:hypothetical protein
MELGNCGGSGWMHLGFCTGSSCRLAAIDTWFERRCEVGVEGHTYLVEGVIESESVVGAVICTCLQRAIRMIAISGRHSNMILGPLA